MYRARLSSTRKFTRRGRKFAASFTLIRPTSLFYRRRTKNRKRSIHHPLRFAAGCRFSAQLIYKAEDGVEIAQALGDGKAVILKNHGAVTIGRSVAEAVVTMFLLDRAADAHLVAGNDLKAWEPDETYLRVADQSYRFLWRTWHWELESGGAMARGSARAGSDRSASRG